jgi:hypothetical protein
MLELQQRKKALAAGIYEAGGNAAAALDAADISASSSRSAEIKPGTKIHRRRTEKASSVLEEGDQGGPLARSRPCLQGNITVKNRFRIRNRPAHLH